MSVSRTYGLQGETANRRKSRPIMIDIIAGGVGGSVGVIFTSPLDVIQTRLQSSAFRMQRQSPTKNNGTTFRPAYFKGLMSYGKHMAKSEGINSLFKGLGLTLLAVTPSRAIYFSTYKGVKDYLNLKQGLVTPNSSGVYFLSGAAAQFVNSTVTNPLWFLKTRLQLDFSQGKEFSILETVRQAYQEDGIRTFFRGLQASYLGMAEVGLHFACYENLKEKLLRLRGKSDDSFIVLECTIAAGVAKVISTAVCYPYEVVRTRMRQQENWILGQQKYLSCLQTLKTIIKEEKFKGLYGGAAINIVRQVPCTTIMFCTYEGVVFLYDRTIEFN